MPWHTTDADAGLRWRCGTIPATPTHPSQNIAPLASSLHYGSWGCFCTWHWLGWGSVWLDGFWCWYPVMTLFCNMACRLYPWWFDLINVMILLLAWMGDRGISLSGSRFEGLLFPLLDVYIDRGCWMSPIEVWLTVGSGQIISGSCALGIDVCFRVKTERLPN